MKELSKEKIIEVQSELIEHLQNYHDSTKTEIVKIVNPTWELYLEDLYSQLSELLEGEEEQNEIIKALSGEVIEDVQTFTTTKMPVEQSQPEQNKYGWDITAREAEENQKHDIEMVEETIFRKHIMEVLERHDKAWTQKDCVTITIPIQVYINAVKELSTPSEPKRKKRKLTPGRDFTMND